MTPRSRKIIGFSLADFQQQLGLPERYTVVDARRNPWSGDLFEVLVEDREHEGFVFEIPEKILSTEIDIRKPHVPSESDLVLARWNTAKARCWESYRAAKDGDPVRQREFQDAMSEADAAEKAFWQAVVNGSTYKSGVQAT